MLIAATYDPGAGFMSDEAHYELAKVDDSTIVSIVRIDGAPIEISFWEFEPGTEEDQVEAFIREMRELEPDVEPYDEDDDEAAGDERHVTFFRSSLAVTFKHPRSSARSPRSGDRVRAVAADRDGESWEGTLYLRHVPAAGKVQVHVLVEGQAVPVRAEPIEVLAEKRALGGGARADGPARP